MKLIRWGGRGKERPGLIDTEGRYRDLSHHIEDVDGTTIDSATLNELAKIDPATLPEVNPDIRLGACLGQVGHFLAIGLNYADHAREAGMEIPKEPIVFSKAPSCISGPFDDIQIPHGSAKTDWEVEIAIVIGRRSYGVTERDALEAVAGFCICNDLSERAYQLEQGGQWIKGKSCPSFGPLGPWLVTRDEISDAHDLSIWLDVNGEKVQNSNTDQMIFRIPEIVAYLSRFMVLEAGDVVTTGTPPGVGMGLSPPRYLKVGDRVNCGIDGLGEQHQVCKAGG